MAHAFCHVCFWHLTDNQTVPVFDRFWTIADKGGFWREAVLSANDP